MKIFSRILSLLVIASLGLFYAGCGGSTPDPDPVEKVQLKKLSKTWTIDAATGATLDAEDKTSMFPGFTITFGGTFNTTTHAGPYNFTVGGTMPTPSPWPTSGTFKFTPTTDADGNGGVISTQDNIAVTYKFDGTKLKLSLTCGDNCNYGNVRAKNVKGAWVFNLH